MFLLMAMKSQLEAENITCETCESGEDAIKLLKSLVTRNEPLFDVILTDFCMPGLSGVQTAIELRKIYTVADIP